MEGSAEETEEKNKEKRKLRGRKITFWRGERKVQGRYVCRHVKGKRKQDTVIKESHA